MALYSEREGGDEDRYALAPGQEVGLAMAFSQKATQALLRAAEAGALVMARDDIEGLVADGRRALDGDSNDAEHDALFCFVEAFEKYLD